MIVGAMLWDSSRVRGGEKLSVGTIPFVGE